MDVKDAELVIRMQCGDKAAFETLFNRYKTRAIQTAYLITGNRATAEDITQETFVKCYLKIKGLKEPAQFKTWFFKILTRVAWKMSSKEKIVSPIENIFELSEVGSSEQIENDLIKKEESAKIMSAIKALEDKQKTTVLLYYYNQFSVGEIAKIMGCFEGTVKSRLYTARKNLKKNLRKEETEIEEGVANAVIYKI